MKNIGYQSYIHTPIEDDGSDGKKSSFQGRLGDSFYCIMSKKYRQKYDN